MIITYHGAGFIKLTSGDTTIAMNPISKKSKLKETKFGADIVFVSLNNPDCNGVDSVTRSSKDIFVIDGPGEYEVSGVFAKGVATTSEYGGESKINTMYSLHIEDIHFVNLGAIKDEKITGKMLDGIDDIDVLFVPIGGDGTVDAAVANKLANSLEAKIVVPTFYNKESLNIYLKEASAEGTEQIEKLVLKKKDLDGKNGQVIVLKA
jgi:hypothetical protein